MAHEFLKYEKKESIAYITINRPERMNALHGPAHGEFAEVFGDFRDDPEMWVAIITGAGEKAFSAGNDLKAQAEAVAAAGTPAPTAGKSNASKARSNDGGFAGITNKFECYKPIIAAVNGYALGGGFEIALACDIIIAADHAKFGLPEPRVGLNAGAGGIHRLPRQIPLKIAMGMMLTGRHITAQEAYRVGIANEVVPLADLMATAEKWAAEILLCAPLSVQSTKEGAMKGLDMSLDEAMNAEFPIGQRMRTSADWIEGPLAFSEKRAPKWTGR